MIEIKKEDLDLLKTIEKDLTEAIISFAKGIEPDKSILWSKVVWARDKLKFFIRDRELKI